MKRLTELTPWKALYQHAQHVDFTAAAPKQKLKCQTVSIDFTNQYLNATTLQLLIQLAEERHLKEKIIQLFSGGPVNYSEHKPALHTALRQNEDQPLFLGGRNIIEDIVQAKRRMRWISEKIRHRQWLGYSGKPIEAIVNIGIGGSDLGPRLCVQALSAYADNHLNYYFIADGDALSFNAITTLLNPETTLFIVCSKSFQTPETLSNAQKAIAWVGTNYEKQFIAVTANAALAHNLGINQVLPLWPWVGGRYSSCSAINLITMIAIGYERFEQLLAGAWAMDQHFLTREFHHNLPVLLALLGIWNINFRHITTLLLLTYSQHLHYFMPYIQQLDMESNGKSVDNSGQKVNYRTAPIIWGGLANQAQHSYFQLLCQGTHTLALDNLLIDDAPNGFSLPLSAQLTSANIFFNHIHLSTCSPFALGELIALYEHKIFVQSVIWDINPFDQPGVEQMKKCCWAKVEHSF